MAITTTADFGRYLTNRGEGEHILNAALPAIEGEDAGIPGGMTEELREAEAARVALAPVVGPVAGHDPYALHFAPRDPQADAPDDILDLPDMVYPRHDRYAAEHTGDAPDRVVPSTPTNANPAFADYEVAVQDRPGAASEAEISYERPAVVAGEGSWETRDASEEATGVTSPVGDEHNDPEGARAADSYDEAKDIAASHGGTIKDFGDPPLQAVVADPEPQNEPQDEPPPAGPPAHGALKAEWVEYVSGNFEVTAEEAQAMTKAELIETYGV